MGSNEPANPREYMSTTIPSYFKSVNHYQPEARPLLMSPPEGTFYQEKYDGSQFAFTLGDEGLVHCRSKSRDLDPNAAGPFQVGVDSTLRAHYAFGLAPGAVYFGEFFKGKRQNQISYGRVPKGHIVLFDVRRSDGTWLSPEELEALAGALGFEPCRWTTSKDVAEAWRESSLGGPVEGYVIKNHANPVQGRYGRLMVKRVQDAFREQRGEKVKSPKGVGKHDEFFYALARKYSNQPRWAKAVQHLRDNGDLDRSMRDVGPLMKEIARDILADHEEDIKQTLFDYAWKVMAKGLFNGFADWYKTDLQAELEGFVPPHKDWPPPAEKAEEVARGE